MNFVDLVTLKTTSTTRLTYQLGDVAACRDATYGPLKAVYCYVQDDLTTANCSPVFEDIAAGKWYVDEDENESGVIGQEYCCGAFLAGAAVAEAFWGWVLVAGLNPIAMLSDGSVAAGYNVIASSTDGTWNGVASSVAAAATAGTAYSGGWIVGTANAADTSNVPAAGSVMFHSVWSNLPVTV